MALVRHDRRQRQPAGRQDRPGPHRDHDRVRLDHPTPPPAPPARPAPLRAPRATRPAPPSTPPPPPPPPPPPRPPPPPPPPTAVLWPRPPAYTSPVTCPIRSSAPSA